MLSRLNKRNETTDRKNIGINSNSLTSASSAFAFVAIAIATNIIYKNGNMCNSFRFYYSNVEYDVEIYRKKQQVFNCYTRSCTKKNERKKENGCSKQWSKSKSLYVCAFFPSTISLIFFDFFSSLLLLRVMRHAENEQEYFELNI